MPPLHDWINAILSIESTSPQALMRLANVLISDVSMIYKVKMSVSFFYLLRSHAARGNGAAVIRLRNGAQAAAT
jgi:hypothetical protein